MAFIHEIQLQGGMMGGMMGMRGSAAWAINGQSMTGDGNPGMPPLFEMELARGDRRGSAAGQRGALRRDVRARALHASHVQPQ